MDEYTRKIFTLADDYCFPRDAALKIEPYLFAKPARIALAVALATGRPLLVAGPPGCGKSRE